MTPTESTPPSKVLRAWLVFLSIVAVIVFILILLFGWAVNLDTMYDVIPSADPLERQGAIEQRIVFWSGIVVFGLFLAAGVVGGWMARARQRNRLAVRLSLLAAVPIVLCIAAFTLAGILGSSY